MSVQLALAVSLRDDATLKNFHCNDSNQEVVECISQLAKPAKSEPILLLGIEASGRSHLLQAACHLASADNRSCCYLPMASDDERITPHVLEGLEWVDVLALDDVDHMAGKPEWEEALFHLFNRCRETDVALLMSSSLQPQDAGFGLKDLASRLSGATRYTLAPPDDDALEAILQLRAKNRGMSLDAGICRYIVHRAPRHLGKLIEMLEELDKASLQKRRKITIPFVRELFGW